MRKLVLAILIFPIIGRPQTSPFVGSGFYSPFSLTTQAYLDGEQEIFSPHLFFSLGASVPWLYNNYFAPELGLVFHREGHGGYGKKTYFLLLGLKRPLYQRFFFHYGYGLFMTSIYGSGAKVFRANGGDDQEDPFFLPGTYQISYNSTLLFGGEAMVWNKSSLALKIFLFRPFSSLRRSISYLFSFSWFLPMGWS